MSQYIPKYKSIPGADGTSRSSRKLEQLSTDYVKIDDRTFDDLLLFASKYAELLNYYNLENEVEGTWKEFFEKDISTFIASISETNCLAIKSDYYYLTKNVSSKESFKKLFEAIISMAKTIDGWYRKSIRGMMLNSEIEIAIQTELRIELKKLIAYDNGYNLLELGETTPTPLGCIYLGLSTMWIDDPNYTNIKDYASSVSPDKSIYSTTLGYKTVYKINQVFNTFYKTLNSIISKTPEYLNESLENWPYHKPHLGLFFAFLKLFKYAQDDINKIGEKHIDYYFRDILKFTEKDITPDAVNIYFELAKNIETHQLAKGTLLFAGKDTDTNKKNILFGLDEELIVNKAKLESFKTLFFSEGNIYTAPIANSVDGNGKECKDGVLKWALFGEDQKDKAEENRTMTDSEIGFGIASPILFLKEGTRTVTFTFYLKETIPNSYNALGSKIYNPNLKVFFSSDKSWVESEIISPLTFDVGIDEDTYVLKIELLVDSGLPAITSYSKETLLNNFETVYPVAKFIFYPNDNNYSSDIIPCFTNFNLQSLQMDVKVEGMTDFIVQNDHTKLDPTKPYMPFTNIPAVGSNFYIGSKEIFQKKIDSLMLNINWLNSPIDLRFSCILNKNTQKNEYSGYYAAYKYVQVEQLDQIILPDSRENIDYKVQVDYLLNNKWTSKDANSNTIVKELFKIENGVILSSKDMMIDDLKNYDRNPEIEDFYEYNNTVKAGFIRLKLTPNDFFHNIYSKVYTAAVLAKNTNKSVNLPNEPYTPQIESLKISYTSSVKIDLNNIQTNRYEQFFHIYPYGSSEFIISDSNTLSSSIIYNSKKLLPEFKIPGSEANIKGAFFIGIKELVPPQTLTLYFRLAEGSENPDIQKPELISWSYLSNNQWVIFNDDELLSDSTEGLAKSGIVKLSIPESTTDTNTLMPSGYFWLQVAVGSNTEAFNKVIGVYPQAASATFINNSNDTSRLADSLAEGSIAKLLVKDTAIKSLTQPDCSFNGKAKENPDVLYARASERLRHKNRLVTAWDYEHLILENFEKVYKVKCLRHTKVVTKDNIKTLYGSAPGHTTIVVVPELRNENAFNPLQPKFGNDKRLEILDLLKKYSSPFVTHYVENPFYETIKIVVEVECRTGYDESFYKVKLNDDLKRFICPWAYDDSADIVLGGKLHKSSILNFIEKLEYIDHILNIQMVKNYDAAGTNNDLNLAVASSEGSVLVSDNSHEII